MPEYDQFFKEFFHLLLYRFLQCYAPELAAQLDLTWAPVFLDKEVPAQPRNRTADILADVRSREKQKRLLHLEAQGQSQAAFSRRMHDYYERFRRRHGSVPIHSLAVLLYRTGRTDTAGRFTEELDGKLFHWFEYGIIPLADLQARDYVDHPDPLVHGLMGILRHDGLDPAQLKAESLANVIRGTMAGTIEREMLVDALERYFVLPAKEHERYRQLTASLHLEEVEEMMTLAEERGLERGIQRGSVGRSREILMSLMRAKFGDVPERVENLVAGMESLEELDRYLVRVLTARDIEEMGFPS